MPKISVIIPVFNTDENLLKKCLDSVCAQTLKDIEIICVDDGSTNGCTKILDEYKNKDDRIIVIRQKNQGQGAARQNGMEHANADFIGFVDSDDEILPTMSESSNGA